MVEEVTPVTVTEEGGADGAVRERGLDYYRGDRGLHDVPAVIVVDMMVSAAAIPLVRLAVTVMEY